MSENGLPKTWNWIKSDLKNIEDIQKFGTKEIKTFPKVNFKMVYDVLFWL